jgi:DNA-directed RNA polymerase subunit RPC12/RpoP
LNEGQVIEDMVLHPEQGVACPRCKGNLLLGPLETLAGVNMREVHCTGCRHSVVLVDLP